MIPAGGGGRNTSMHPMLAVFSTKPIFGSDFTGGGNRPPDFQNSQLLQFQAQITAYHMIVRAQHLPPQLLVSAGCNMGHIVTSAQAFQGPWHVQPMSTYNHNHTALLDSLSPHLNVQSRYICVLPHPGVAMARPEPFCVDSLVASQPVLQGHDGIVDQAVVCPHPDQSSSLITSCTPPNIEPVLRNPQPQHLSVISISAKSSDDQETKVQYDAIVLFSLGPSWLLNHIVQLRLLNLNTSLNYQRHSTRAQ